MRYETISGRRSCMLSNTLVLSVMIIYAMYNVNATLATYSLIPIPIISILILFVNKVINRRSERIQRQLSRLSSFVQETFSGIRVIRTYTENEIKWTPLKVRAIGIGISRLIWSAYRPCFSL